MNDLATQFDLLWPAFAAGLIVLATHVPLGIQVLARGIIFIDLAVAQVAGLGALLAHLADHGDSPWAVQGAAVGAALGAALLLQWSEKRWPQLQEALIGLLFVLAASGAVLLLARDAHGGEHLRDLLVGQMLWVSHGQLLAAAAVSAGLLLAWRVFGRQGGSLTFYTLFAVAVTVSVQLVGVYLVFASLIVPALATHGLRAYRLAVALGTGAAGYAGGLALAAWADWPAGAASVWMLAATGLLLALIRSGVAPPRSIC
ncbi:MAG: metal ABC transporter permease [Betaproteobacteria bacterium]|jgi:zinc/manganese transport system permease protein|nr:metal ABC transporter permease [Betaproteobacteria bacterium]